MIQIKKYGQRLYRPKAAVETAAVSQKFDAAVTYRKRRLSAGEIREVQRLFKTGAETFLRLSRT